MNFDLLKKMKAGWGWARFIWGVLGALGATAAITGAAVTVGGPVWAIIVGVPIPVAVMAGFCTFVGTLYLTLTPWAWRVLRKVEFNEPAAKIETDVPNYEALRHVDRFTLSEAARLWCDIDPNSRVGTLDTGAWQNAFAGAIRTGDLDFVGRHSRKDGERADPSWDTIITKTALIDFAKRHGHTPTFLKEFSKS